MATMTPYSCGRRGFLLHGGADTRLIGQTDCPSYGGQTEVTLGAVGGYLTDLLRERSVWLQCPEVLVAVVARLLLIW